MTLELVISINKINKIFNEKLISLEKCFFVYKNLRKTDKKIIKNKLKNY